MYLLPSVPVEEIVRRINENRSLLVDGIRPTSDHVRDLLYRIHKANMLQDVDQDSLANFHVLRFITMRKQDRELVKAIIARLRGSRLNKTFLSQLLNVTLHDGLLNQPSPSGNIGFLILLAVGLEEELRDYVEEDVVLRVRRVIIKCFDKSILLYRERAYQYGVRIVPSIARWNMYRYMEKDDQAILRTIMLVRNDPSSSLALMPNELLMIILSFLDTATGEDSRRRNSVDRLSVAEVGVSVIFLAIFLWLYLMIVSMR